MAQITLNSTGVASNGTLALQSNGTTTAVTIDASQNVGIGTSSPVGKLHVTSASAAASSTAGTPIILQAQSGGSSANGGNVLIGSGSNGSGAANGYIAFGIGSATSGSAFSSGESVRIDVAGNLLVGTTDAAPRNFTSGFGFQAGAGLFQVASSSGANYFNLTSASGTIIEFRRQAGTVGAISTNGATTTYGTSSDYRLKENVVPMTGALAKVSLLKPCTYVWKANGEADEGFIAHELAEVCPSAVQGEKDGEEMQGVDYGKLTPILTAALQEAIAKIETLEARIAVLEAK